MLDLENDVPNFEMSDQFGDTITVSAEPGTVYVVALTSDTALTDIALSPDRARKLANVLRRYADAAS